MVDFEKLLKESKDRKEETMIRNISEFVNLQLDDKFNYIVSHPNTTVNMIDFLVNQTKDNHRIRHLTKR